MDGLFKADIPSADQNYYGLALYQAKKLADPLKLGGIRCTGP
jgi:hypothetical protein